MPEGDWELLKHRLEIIGGGSNTDRLKYRLIDIAQNAITHVDTGLINIARGEASPDDLFRNDPSHDFNHALRVLKLAENMSLVGGDLDIIRAAVLLHDVITHSKNSAGAKTETEESAHYAEDLLREANFPPNKIKKVVDIITKSSFSKGVKAGGDEATILYDADKMDQTGAMGVMRYFASGGQMNREFYNPEDPTVLNKERVPEVFKYTVDALVDRLPKIVETIDTPTARVTAQQRNQFLELFLNELRLEIKESKNRQPHVNEELPGAMHMMQAFSKAGKESRTFYDIKDPFCNSRELKPEVYPLDDIILRYRKLVQDSSDKTKTRPEIITILRRREFLEAYFKELKYELEGELVPPPRLKIKREYWVEENE